MSPQLRRAPSATTLERDAADAVPDEFMQVQWTRLPGALPTPQFVDQVKRLMAGRPWTGQRKGDRTSSTPTAAVIADPAPEQKPEGKAPIFAGRRRGDFPRWAWAAIAAVVIVGAIVAWLVMRPEASSAKNQSGSGAIQPTPAKEGDQPGKAPAADKSIAVLPRCASEARIAISASVVRPTNQKAMLLS